MNLSRMLAARAAEGRPVRVALIGAGKFRLDVSHPGPAHDRRAGGGHRRSRPGARRRTLATCGWPDGQSAASSLDEAMESGATHVTDDLARVLADARIEVVIEATGDPAVGIRHALAVIEAGKHLVMVNVEADVLAGPLLARRFADAGLVYSMAYGDQPALVCELVNWARACGLEVVAAGKGTKYLPEYHTSTPGSVWDHYGLTPRQAAADGLNPKMFNSCLDGTKSAIEMAAVANATDLSVPKNGLMFPPVGCDYLAQCLKPTADGRPVAG